MFERSYEWYQLRIDEMELSAFIYAAKGEKELAAFYHNAAEGYKIKAERLTLGEAAHAN